MIYKNKNSAAQRLCARHSRREFLCKAGAGFGAVALSGLAGRNLLATEYGDNPVAAKIPHATGKAKNIIFLYMEGGPSHLDLFDPKPLLRCGRPPSETP